MGVTGTGLPNHLSGRTTVAYSEGANEPRAHSLRAGEWYQRASPVLWRIYARLVPSFESHREEVHPQREIELTRMHGRTAGWKSECEGR